jgi:hypothetical protein
MSGEPGRLQRACQGVADGAVLGLLRLAGRAGAVVAALPYALFAGG